MTFSINTQLWTADVSADDLYLIDRISGRGFDGVQIAVQHDLDMADAAPSNESMLNLILGNDLTGQLRYKSGYRCLSTGRASTMMCACERHNRDGPTIRARARCPRNDAYARSQLARPGVADCLRLP